MTVPVVTAIINQDATFSLMARFEVDGANGVQADCSSIAITGTDMSTNSSVLSSSLTVADVVFDTLQTDDGRWDEDATGYNFRYDVADSICTSPNVVYRFKVVVTTSGGDLPAFLYEVTTASEM